MEPILDFLKGFNFQTLISLTVIVWWFSASIKSEMKLLENKIDRQSERTDKLYVMFIDLLKEKRE